MDERDHKAMNEELNQPSCLGAVIRSFPDNVKTTEIYTHVSFLDHYLEYPLFF